MKEKLETGQLVATAAVNSKMKSDEDFYKSAAGKPTILMVG